MERGFNIGQVFGININIDFSWILVFLLVTGTLALSVFPGLHPEWSVFLNVTVGIIASVLFFASVLAHELAHSLVARARGISVKNITLFLFGGVSDIESEPSSAKAEFLIAIVGPLTSISLGFIFLFLAGIISGEGTNVLVLPDQVLSNLGPVTTLLLWLGPVNVLLGIFNLIPGFPLDGGRVLRSLIWALTQNFRQATRFATLGGQVVGWGFIAIGVLMIFGFRVPILGGGLISGLWLILIGRFLSSLASASYQKTVVEGALNHLKVAKIMQTDLLIIPPETSVAKLVDEFIKKKEGAFPVMTDSQLKGIVTLQDVSKVPRKAWSKILVSQVMTPVKKLEIVGPDENAAEALNKFAKYNVGQFPVVKNKKLIGILSRRDILLWLQLYSQKDAV